MKKLFFPLMFVAVAAATFTSCKKGENDPFLSLRSRKARLAGEWKVSSSEFTRIEDGETVYSSKYDGNRETGFNNFSGISFEFEDFYTEEYTFEKDGTYSNVITATDGSGASANMTGNWVFVGKNKNGELKNKEAIILSSLQTTENFGSGNGSYTETNSGSLQADDILIFDQLKEKEIIILVNETSSAGGSTTTRTGKIVLTKK